MPDCAGNVFIAMQRLVAISILHDLYKAEGSDKNPFLPFFLSAFEHGDEPGEKLFIADLLISPPTLTKEVRRHTIPSCFVSSCTWLERSCLYACSRSCERAPRPSSTNSR